MNERTDERPRAQRTVVSFVRRSARMTPYQRTAWEGRRARYLVDVARGELSTSIAPQAPLDLDDLFGRPAPLVVEIGPGTGETLVPMARARPEQNLLAFEVYEPAVARLVGAVERAGVETVRVVQGDAAQGLEVLLVPDAVAELWTFFPDPWRKARHHKRRLVDVAFAGLAASRVRRGGVWRLATDWPDYAEQMVAVLDGHPAWQPLPVGERRQDRPVSRFEQRGLNAGREIVDLAYRRI